MNGENLKYHIAAEKVRREVRIVVCLKCLTGFPVFIGHTVCYCPNCGRKLI